MKDVKSMSEHAPNIKSNQTSTNSKQQSVQRQPKDQENVRILMELILMES